MTTVPDNKPHVEFWPHSDITEMKRGVDYAATILSAGRSDYDLTQFTRPVRVCWTGPLLVVVDPDAPAADGARLLSDPDYRVVIVGRWTDFRGDWFEHETWTWQQYAAHQYGQVLRHNNLADRLTDFGIRRTHETYLPRNQTGNHVERSLTLNYDELDALLRAAGF